MSCEEILDYVLTHFEGTVLIETWGEKSIFFNPNRKLKRGTYILTIKDHDGPNDKASDLNRTGVFRVNFKIKKETYTELFGNTPKRPAVGKTTDEFLNFSKTDVLMPHPVYAWMNWCSILNPSEKNFKVIIPFLEEAYDLSVSKYKRRIRKVSSN